MSSHWPNTSPHQSMLSSRIDQLEREMNAHTVRKSKSGRWKTQKGRRGTIIRNWCMDSTNGGIITSSAVPSLHKDELYHYHPSSNKLQENAYNYANQQYGLAKTEKSSTPHQNTTQPQFATRPTLPLNWQNNTTVQNHKKETHISTASIVVRAVPAMAEHEEIRETERLFHFLEEYDASPKFLRKQITTQIDYESYDDLETTSTRL